MTKMSKNLEIIIGTYEEFLLGYRLETKNDKEVLTQSFADKSHTGSLKCLAVQGRWIATGATDDRIFIYDMKTRKQSQILLTHEGTINALAFTPDGTHLLSGAADGRMIAVRLNTWFTEANWTKAHNGAAVTHICCHPSGKLALSLGSDLVLRTWNLVKGRVAYKTNLKSRSSTLGTMPDCLSWSPSGDYFTLTGQRVVEFWSIKSADVVKSQKTTSKPICVQWINDTDCLIGLEDGKIVCVSATANAEDVHEIKAHEARVKTMALYEDILVTASSSGEVKLWRVSGNKKKLKQIAATSIGCRPTCIGLLDLHQFGADYIITKTIEQQQEDTKANNEKTNTKKEAQERGIVTIEYANDEEDNKVNASESDAVEDGDDDDEATEESNEELDNDDDDDENDDDVEDDDDEDDDEDVTEDDSNSEDEVPQIPLPKSRKRKQEILRKEKQETAKNPKLSVNSKDSKQKKQKSTPKNSNRASQKKQKKPKIK